MSKRSEVSHTRVITDPNNEPVRVVDQASFHPPLGVDIDLTLCTFLNVPFGQGGFTPAAVITARLRMKIDMARALVDGLTKQIAMAEAAGGTVN